MVPLERLKSLISPLQAAMNDDTNIVAELSLNLRRSRAANISRLSMMVFGARSVTYPEEPEVVSISHSSSDVTVVIDDVSDESDAVNKYKV